MSYVVRKIPFFTINNKCTLKFFYGAFFILHFLVFANVYSQTSLEEKNFYNLLTISNENENILCLKSVEIKEFELTGSISSTQEFRMRKSPIKAAVYSALLPGAGQFYNESYWKIPIILGLGGYFLYELIDNNKKYNDYKDLYIASQTPENQLGNLQLRANRDHYRDQRDNFIIYFAILYIANIADAYVDAHLYDFDVSDEMKLGFFKKGKIINLSYGF